MITIRDSGGTPRNIVAVKMRDSGSTLRTVLNAFARDSTALRNIFTSFGGGSGLTLSTYSVSGFGYSKASITISTSSVTVTVTGGVPPYTYSWTGPGSPWSATDPTSATTSFRRSGVGQGASYMTNFTCTVTDANGHSSTSDAVEAYVENNY